MMRNYIYVIVFCYLFPKHVHLADHTFHLKNHNQISHFLRTNTMTYPQLLNHFKTPHRFENINRMKQILPYIKNNHNTNWNRMDLDNHSNSTEKITEEEVSQDKPEEVTEKKNLTLRNIGIADYYNLQPGTNIIDLDKVVHKNYTSNTSKNPSIAYNPLVAKPSEQIMNPVKNLGPVFNPPVAKPSEQIMNPVKNLGPVFNPPGQNLNLVKDPPGYAYYRPVMKTVEQNLNQFKDPGYVYNRPVKDPPGYVYNRPIMKPEQNLNQVKDPGYVYNRPVMKPEQNLNPGYVYNRPVMNGGQMMNQPKNPGYTYNRPISGSSMYPVKMNNSFNGIWFNDYKLHVKNKLIGFDKLTPYVNNFKNKFKKIYKNWLRDPFNKYMKRNKNPNRFKKPSMNMMNYGPFMNNGDSYKTSSEDPSEASTLMNNSYFNYGSGNQPYKLKPYKQQYHSGCDDSNNDYDYYFQDESDYSNDCPQYYYYPHYEPQQNDTSMNSNNKTGILASLFGGDSGSFSTLLMMAGMIGFLILQNLGTMGFMGIVMSASPILLILGLVKYFIYSIISTLIKLAIVPFLIPFAVLLLLPLLLLLPFIFLLLLPLFFLPILIPFLMKLCSICGSSGGTTITYNYTVIFSQKSAMDQDYVFPDFNSREEDIDLEETTVNQTVLSKIQSALDSEYCLENLGCHLASNTKYVTYYNDLIYGVLKFLSTSVKDSRFKSYMKAYKLGSDIGNNHTTCSAYFPCTKYEKILLDESTIRA